MKHLFDAADLLHRPEELRARAAADGYLYLRGLIARERVLDVRRDFCRILEEHGWLDAGTVAMDAVSTQEPRVEMQESYWPVFDAFQHLESFHSLPHTPSLIRAVETLFGEAVLAHPRNIARIIFPQAAKFSTPPHQDYVHIQGTPETWTSWIPLGDCPIGLGGLAVMPGTHHELLPVKDMSGAGGVGIPDEYLPGEWHASDMRAGDVLLVHSHTVHRGLHNLSADRIRISVDYRFQPASYPVCETSLQPHQNRFRWDDVYAGWSSGALQYYWKSMALTVTPFDRGVYKVVPDDRGNEPAKVGY